MVPGTVVSHRGIPSEEPPCNKEEEWEDPPTSPPPLATTALLAIVDKSALRECVEIEPSEELLVVKEQEGTDMLLDPILAEEHPLPQPGRP